MQPILFVINRLSVGGAERLAVDELHELHRRGIEAHVATLYPEGLSSLLGELKIPKHYIHQSVSFFALFSLMRKLKPRAVICHLWYANTVGRVIGWLAGVRTIVVFEHNVYDQVKSRKQFFFDRLLQPLAKRIIAVSGPVRASLVQHGIDARSIMVLHNAIDVERYKTAQAADIVSLFGLPQDAYIVLAVGRLTRQKGFDVLINALPHLPERAHVLFFGMGEEEQSLRNLAHTLGVAKRVHFGGISKEIPSMLKAAHCLAMPSRWEGEPILLLEALAAGIPVVGSDIGPLRELITEGVNGYLASVDDTQAFAGALLRAMGADGVTLSLPSNRTIEHHTDSLLSVIT